jgi:predicted nucleotidyltransferase
MVSSPQEDERIRHAAAILRQFGATEVFLFGSAASGIMRPDSDVDMAVSGLPPQVFFRAMAQAEKVLARTLDLVALDEQTPFADHLRRKGRLHRVA